MNKNTLDFLKCPKCNSKLFVEGSSQNSSDVIFGQVVCIKCKQDYPILAGVLILVPDVHSYIVEHAKGIARYVADKDIPKKYRVDFLEAKQDYEQQHIEEDLEAERVTALYVMNHYLDSKNVNSSDPLLQELIKKYWDYGPFKKITEFTEKLVSPKFSQAHAIELGCGVGGLYLQLKKELKFYLGLDSSFASIALARHLALGYSLKNHRILVPNDLLDGPVSREIFIPKQSPSSNADFIVCDLANPPVKKEMWQVSYALNVMDMLPDPNDLPKLQHKLLVEGGFAIQSCPYIWHPQVAKVLRKEIPAQIRGSDQAAEHLYKQSKFKILQTESHIPWLFFKNMRQLEIYSVHLFCASKT